MMTPFRLVQVSLLWAVLLPAAVNAQFVFVTNADNTITITDYIGTNDQVTIPDTTNGYPVTTIGSDAFYNCTRCHQRHDRHQRHQP